jgi:hypothetical protein
MKDNGSSRSILRIGELIQSHVCIALPLARLLHDERHDARE